MANERINNVNSVFEQPWWLDVVAGNKWKEVIIQNKNGDVIGRLPYIEKKMYSLNICTVPILTQQIGPWIRFEKNMKPVAKLKRIKNTLEEIILRLNKYKNIDLYFHREITYILPFIWAGYNVEARYSYVIEDLSNIELVQSNMDTKVRNIIKNAYKNLSVVENLDVDTLIKMVESTFDKQHRKLPMGKDCIIRIYQESMKHNAGKALGAVDKSGKVVAAAFLLYDHNTCYYLMGGKDYGAGIQGSQELLLWEGIKFASLHSKEFDFEGSMIPGIESFFRGFGGKPCIYFRVYRGNFLFQFLNGIKPYVKKLLGYK